MEFRRHQELKRQPKIPDQEKEWPNDTREQDLEHRLNSYPYPNTIRESVPR